VRAAEEVDDSRDENGGMVESILREVSMIAKGGCIPSRATCTRAAADSSAAKRF
jgi:hypothetical protein